ncbi:MAG: flagellum-specific peptidoglycan hydrolase FlgJ [Saprospiraceae bacterium]|jgi:flagellum-specific peptidoglycan hydrolase FlgJ|uniref:glucosaminidase domain-containing protein n=1 Tax=Patiriisocius sp. Uisw_047 TaxID=3230969 RepID=UPI0039E77974
MKKGIYIFVVLLLVVLVQSGCKSRKQVVAKERTERVVKDTPRKKPRVTAPVVVEPKKNETYADVVANYIATYSEIAKQEMDTYGIPASITLAQGILESGAGRGELTRKAQNHFGIKCHSGWTGERAYHDDDELQECFRKYTDPQSSFRDHSLFLSQRSRYKSLFSLERDDYKGWAKGLRKAGYATDPKYPDKLISIIERYDLEAYDDEVLGNKKRRKKSISTSEISQNSHTVVKGDTLYSIARKHKLTVEELRSINGLNSNDISIGQTLSLQLQ